MNEIESKVFRSAKHYIGRPYIWGGKGPILWTASGSLLHGFSGPVFDCSGLITQCLLEAGLGDWKLHHSAQTLFNKLGQLPSPIAVYTESHPALAFFGKSPSSIIHVGIFYTVYRETYMIDASGGGSNTHMPTPGAQVWDKPLSRSDLIGFRTIPVTKDALK